MRLWDICRVKGLIALLLFQFQKVRLWGTKKVSLFYTFSVISIPKGAIMSSGKQTKRNCTISDFNSKRCDYESLNHISAFNATLFQFQKVRLWERKNLFLAHRCSNFNSKRCDYEKSLIFSIILAIFYFNSKRCDYEYFIVRFTLSSKSISIPKGAIMRYLHLHIKWFS